MFGPISFRRILLSRILLLSVPVLLTGQYVTYRKTRSTLLDTARYNLTQSAEHKRDRFQDFFFSIHSSLVAVSDSTALRSGDLEASTRFLQQLAANLPSNVSCLWLESIETRQVVAQTCDRVPTNLPGTRWQVGSIPSTLAQPGTITLPSTPTGNGASSLNSAVTSEPNLAAVNPQALDLQTVFLPHSVVSEGSASSSSLDSPSPSLPGTPDSESASPTLTPELIQPTQPTQSTTQSTIQPNAQVNSSPTPQASPIGQMPTDRLPEAFPSGTANPAENSTVNNPAANVQTASFQGLETALVFSTPIYSATNEQTIGKRPASNEPPRYLLRLVSTLPLEDFSPASINSTVPKSDRATDSLASGIFIVSKNGTILAHPVLSYVGQNISVLPDAPLLQAMLKQVGSVNNLTSLMTLDTRGRKVIFGKSVLYLPMAIESDTPWVIMSVSDLDSVLATLTSIQQVMLNLVLLLLAANLIATLYLARDLARPVERLGRYAHSIELNSMPEPLPDHFAIHEFNQLSKTLKSTIERLKAWASEFEVAWKDARTANQLKSEFLTTISHELRTPLNGIIGSIRIIRDGLCDDRKEELEFLQRADDSAVHLLEIVNDILDISKIESGTLSVQFEQANLHQEIDEVLSFFHHDLEEKNLELILKPASSPLFVYTDPSKLRRVLLNVISNAIKFTDVGQIEIMTRTEVDALNIDEQSDLKESSLYAVVEVRDTGIGIEPPDLQKVFQPFVMVDGSRTRKFGGTGLGLAISHNLMGMMDGSIAISSPGADCGTTVTIHIPLAASSLKLRQMMSQKGAGETAIGEIAINETESSEVRSS